MQCRCLCALKAGFFEKKKKLGCIKNEQSLGQSWSFLFNLLLSMRLSILEGGQRVIKKCKFSSFFP
jgi:hypothetical protein